MSGEPSTPTMKNSFRCACFAAKSQPMAVGSLIAKTASIFVKAVNRSLITRKPASRLPPAFWSWDRILRSGCFLISSKKPATRSVTAVTGGPLTMTICPLPFKSLCDVCAVFGAGLFVVGGDRGVHTAFCPHVNGHNRDAGLLRSHHCRCDTLAVRRT